jgi:hypothetical protein
VEPADVVQALREHAKALAANTSAAQTLAISMERLASEFGALRAAAPPKPVGRPLEDVAVDAAEALARSMFGGGKKKGRGS